MNIYEEELHQIIHGNKMREYEEINMPFIATKLIEINKKSGRRLSLIIRSDYIVDDTYWLVRYFRSKQVEPAYILSTASVKQGYGQISGVQIITIDDLDVDNTRDCILIYINRESDTQVFTQEDYRESDYGFVFRGRGKLQYANWMGVRNYAYILKHEEEYYKVLAALEDDESRKSFIAVIRSLLENDVYRYHEYQSDLKYFDPDIYETMGEDEVWINCGSATGDTILHYLSMGREYRKIYAVETSEQLVTHLETVFALLPDGGGQIEIYNRAFEGKDGRYSIDSVFAEEKVTLINMDIEGAELIVLEGAEKKIREDRPVLAIAAYHKPGDLLEIPKLIADMDSGYHVYFRKYKGWAPDVINEYIYYAVPTERLTGRNDHG